MFFSFVKGYLATGEEMLVNKFLIEKYKIGYTNNAFLYKALVIKT